MGEVLALTAVFIGAAVIAVAVLYGAVYLILHLAIWVITRGR